MHIVITGGGTGGHLYPCLALASTFVQRDAATQILFIGTQAGLEARIVPEQGFQFQAIFAKGVVGKSPWQKVIGLFYILIGLFQALAYLKRFAPRLVIGIGGYVAGPVLMAAFLLRIKRVILEPNYVPGMMNLLLAPFVHLVVTAFDETGTGLRAKKIACLGVPVRADISAVSRVERAPTAFQTILIMGGSQGAHVINHGLIKALPFLKDQPIQVIHQTGEKDFDAVRQAYAQQGVAARVMKFINPIAEAYAVADLVISRAGAGTLSELAAAGLPALLIPFPHAKGHQAKNAQPFIASGAAEMILEEEWAVATGASLAQRMLSLLGDAEKLSHMRHAARRLSHPDAASEIVSACLRVAADASR